MFFSSNFGYARSRIAHFPDDIIRLYYTAFLQVFRVQGLFGIDRFFATGVAYGLFCLAVGRLVEIKIANFACLFEFFRPARPHSLTVEIKCTAGHIFELTV